MPSVFLYEFLTAGGCWSLGAEPPNGSLLQEGAAMRDSLAADFAACDFIYEVHLLHDARLPEPRIARQRLHKVTSAADEARFFQQAAREADRTIIIAPEFADCLAQRVRWAAAADAKMLSPGIRCVELAASKQCTADFLASANIPTPRGFSWRGAAVPVVEANLFPAVLKPLDGAGSTHVQFLADADALAIIDLSTEPAWRLEQFQPGQAVSVALLSGAGSTLVLPACSQRLSSDGRFQYLGGSIPLPGPLARRAQQLASRVSEVLPEATGYLGIDIVLGAADNGNQDVVIEINPRLTTSYMGLRQACEQNLAEVMWRLDQNECPRLSFRNENIQFSPSLANDAA